MYSPTQGRFITNDPIGFEAGDVNLYRYVENNPANRVDPSGTSSLFPITVTSPMDNLGPFGAFNWEIRWQLSRKPKGSSVSQHKGVILQHVTVKGRVTTDGQNSIPLIDPKKPGLDFLDQDYWERWVVDPDGNITPSEPGAGGATINDFFRFTGVPADLRGRMCSGWITFTGSAIFIDNMAKNDLHDEGLNQNPILRFNFEPNNPNTGAGGLFSVDTRGGNNGISVFIEQQIGAAQAKGRTSNWVHREITVTWDATGKTTVWYRNVMGRVDGPAVAIGNAFGGAIQNIWCGGVPKDSWPE